MKEYIGKFLSVIFSLNLFLSGVSNSMEQTSLEEIHKLSIDVALKNKVYDRVTGEEIPLGGIDKEEILSDGTKLIYVSQKNIESRKEEIKKIITRSIVKYDLETGRSLGGGIIVGASLIASAKCDSNVPLFIGAMFLPEVYKAFKYLYFEATNQSRSHVSYVGHPLRYFKTANDYPYGLVLMQRPSKIDSNVGVHYSCVYKQDFFNKDTLIKEIARGC